MHQTSSHDRRRHDEDKLCLPCLQPAVHTKLLHVFRDSPHKSLTPSERRRTKSMQTNGKNETGVTRNWDLVPGTPPEDGPSHTQEARGPSSCPLLAIGSQDFLSPQSERFGSLSGGEDGLVREGKLALVVWLLFCTERRGGGERRALFQILYVLREKEGNTRSGSSSLSTWTRRSRRSSAQQPLIIASTARVRCASSLCDDCGACLSCLLCDHQSWHCLRNRAGG